MRHTKKLVNYVFSSTDLQKPNNNLHILVKVIILLSDNDLMTWCTSCSSLRNRIYYRLELCMAPFYFTTDMYEFFNEFLLPPLHQLNRTYLNNRLINVSVSRASINLPKDFISILPFCQ